MGYKNKWTDSFKGYDNAKFGPREDSMQTVAKGRYNKDPYANFSVKEIQKEMLENNIDLTEDEIKKFIEAENYPGEALSANLEVEPKIDLKNPGSASINPRGNGANW